MKIKSISERGKLDPGTKKDILQPPNPEGDSSNQETLGEAETCLVLTTSDLGKSPALALSDVPESLIKLVEEILKDGPDSVRESTINMNIWDFAGQGLYYTTHKMFLSSASIFILTYDLSKDMKELATKWTEDGFSNGQVLEFWLDSIYAHTKHFQPLSVLLVGTHAGQVTQTQIKNVSDYIQDMIEKKPYCRQIVQSKFEDMFYTVENKCLFSQNNEAQRLKKYIENKIIPDILEKRDKQPLRWLEFEKYMKTMQTDSNQEKTFASFDEVKELAVQSKVVPDRDGEETLMIILQFLHDIGSIIYYGAEDVALRNLIILRPEWLLEVFRKLIIVPRPINMNYQFKVSWTKLKEKHILDVSLMDYALGDLKETKASIIELMKKYTLLCERVRGKEISYYVPFVLVEDEGKEGDQDRMPYIVNRRELEPCELGVVSMATFYIDFKGFLPGGVFHQLVVKALQWSETECAKVDFSTPEPEIYCRHLTANLDTQHTLMLDWMPCSQIKVSIAKLFHSENEERQEVSACQNVWAFLKRSLWELLSTMGIHGVNYEFLVDLRDYPPCSVVVGPCGTPTCRIRLRDCFKDNSMVSCTHPKHVPSRIDVLPIQALLKGFPPPPLPNYPRFAIQEEAPRQVQSEDIEPSNAHILDGILNELLDNEVERLKQVLPKGVPGGVGIPPAEMEHADRLDLAKLMVKHLQPVSLLMETLQHALYLIPRKDLLDSDHLNKLDLSDNATKQSEDNGALMKLLNSEIEQLKEEIELLEQKLKEKDISSSVTSNRLEENETKLNDLEEQKKNASAVLSKKMKKCNCTCDENAKILGSVSRVFSWKFITLVVALFAIVFSFYIAGFSSPQHREPQQPSPSNDQLFSGKNNINQIPAPDLTNQSILTVTLEPGLGERKHIMLLCDEWSSSKGGLSTFNRELALHLAEYCRPRGCQVSCMLTEFTPTDEEEAKRWGVEIFRGVTPTPGGTLSEHMVDGVEALPADNRPTVIVGHALVTGGAAFRIQRRFKYRRIQFLHTSPEDLGMTKSGDGAIKENEGKLERLVGLCQGEDVTVVAVGPYLQSIYQSKLTPYRKEVINFTPGLNRQLAGWDPDVRETSLHNVFIVCRGQEEDRGVKGMDIAGEAIAWLAENNRPVAKHLHLTYMGAAEGKENEVKKWFLDNTAISTDNLRIRSFKDQEGVHDSLKAADLLLMPSRAEGFGLVALEAISAAVTVRISHNNGLAMAMEKARIGHDSIVESNDPKVWAKKIEDILEKPRRERVRDAKLLRDDYDKAYRWSKACEKLFEK